MKSAKVPLKIWPNGGWESKCKVVKCSVMAESSEKVYCVPCCAECEDNVFVKTQRFMCKSRVVTRLEPHARLARVRDADARVAHVRDADKTSCANYRSKNHVCGNATLRAGLVACVHHPSLTTESTLPVSETPCVRQKKISLIPW